MQPRSEKVQLDFVVIGAQKAGTTSIHRLLQRHPAVAVPLANEAPYFGYAGDTDAVWRCYLETHFAGARIDQLWGTVTPQYMAGARAIPEAIRRRLPAVKIVAVLRDPVERAISHYRMERLEGRENRSMDLALSEELCEENLTMRRAECDTVRGYIALGEYARILEPYFEIFGAKQIFVEFTENLVRTSTINDLFAFLGLGASVPGPVPHIRRGADSRWISGVDVYKLQTYLAGSSLYRGLWQRLGPATRVVLSRRFDETARRLDLLNRRSANSVPALSAETRAKLTAHFQQDAARLQKLLGASRLPWETVGCR